MTQVLSPAPHLPSRDGSLIFEFTDYIPLLEAPYLRSVVPLASGFSISWKPLEGILFSFLSRPGTPKFFLIIRHKRWWDNECFFSFSYVSRIVFSFPNKFTFFKIRWEKMQQSHFHSVIIFTALWLNQHNDPGPICVMAQGPGGSLSLGSEQDEPSAQRLPLWLPASPWLPAETLLPRPLRWGELPPHQVARPINIRWAELQTEEKYIGPGLPKGKSSFFSIDTRPHGASPWLIWLPQFLSLVKLDISFPAAGAKGSSMQCLVAQPFPSHSCSRSCRPSCFSPTSQWSFHKSLRNGL